MASILTAGEAAARIAYLASDLVISVQPSLAIDSEFSTFLRSYAERKAPGIVSKSAPEVGAVRHNADPLLSVFQPIRNGKIVSVTTDSSILLQSVPHLYKLAQYPLVLHVSLQPSAYPDYSEITAIRQCGFIFLQSDTLQEVQDMAMSAHALALKSGKGVIHFFNSGSVSQDDPIAYESRDLLRQILDLDSARRFQGMKSNETNIYADDGRIASLPVIGSAPHINNPSPSVPRSSQVLEKISTPTSAIANARSNSSTASDSSHRDSSEASGPASSVATSVESVSTRPVTFEDIDNMLASIWGTIKDATKRSYEPFHYSGPASATSAIFLFGADSALFGQAFDSAMSSDVFQNAGMITPRLYRPWIGPKLLSSVPTTVKKIAVVEQIRRKTTKWGPILLDLLMSTKGANLQVGREISQVVGYQLGYIEPATIRQALRGIFQNLFSDKPLQNLEVGLPEGPRLQEQAGNLGQPDLENAYMKILRQIFGDRLHVANELGRDNAGVSAQLAATPEYGFGKLIARFEHRQRFLEDVKDTIKTRDFTTDAPQRWLKSWALEAENAERANSIAPDVIARLATDGSPVASKLLASKKLLFQEANWLIGSDAWAYDLGNSGVHHVIASGQNVNMLIIDSQPYSERTAADATKRKKDIGLYAMNFGNAYVASVAVYGSYTQVLQAMIEAEQFQGPSVVMAYLPYNKESDTPLTVLQETKKSIDLGYWPLYRWNPRAEEKGEQNFQLDSERIRNELQEFLRRDNYMTQLMNRHPQFAANLSESYGSEVRATQKRKAKDAYSKLLEGLYGAPMTVLFASDNGNAESLAKRLANRGKARGLKSMVMSMDDYPMEDMPTEENLVLITSTAGQGEFPQNGRAFWEAVKTSTDLDLANVNFTVFAIGDSHYWPRKEDKIYYNKPGKDLFARIAALGGKVLTEIGLGDDQDPDQYQTGYSDWEPKLWQALGVDKVEGIPDEPPPLTNEDIKIQSNYLRGTITEGLQDTSTGAISASDAQLTKFHGTYMEDDRDLRDERKAQGLEPAYAFMIRCRLPAGVATPDQWLKMDAIAQNLGNETMKLTTRQTFQFHGVIKGKLKPTMQAINKALMTTIAACGDVNRNVMCSVIPSQSQFHADVFACAKKINDYLLPSTNAYHEIWLQDDNDKKTQVAGDAVQDQEPLYGPTYLPRKFKITIAVPPHNDTDVYAHDIGLIAIRNSDGHLEGFNVLAGGGMGVTHNMKKTYPRTGSMMGYVSKDVVHEACKNIMFVQRDNGDRKDRKHARLKYTIDDMGVDVFRSKVEEYWGQKFDSARPFKFDSNIDTFGWQKDEAGLNHFTFFIENGRIEDTATFPMKTGLRELANTLLQHQRGGEFRLTPNQHLVLSNIPDDLVPEIRTLLEKYKLDNTDFSGLRLSSSACVAFPTCGLAMAESERYLPALISKLEDTVEEAGLRHDSIVMRMTGCPNGCARPWLGEVAFVGKAYGAYNMYLGGGYHGQRLNKLYRSSIKEEEIVEIMRGFIKRYSLERRDGERFGDWCIRTGLINETFEGKDFHANTAEEEEDE
ncbi:MAG: hypothetical protein M1821_000738 [Bathelium mastoideum]|nr:MAG: hypothetical protein M1821_000738 [Bathelium mastoideum]